MRGRWLTLLLVGLVCALATAAGLAVLIVPGVLIFLLLAFAGPITIMEQQLAMLYAWFSVCAASCPVTQ